MTNDQLTPETQPDPRIAPDELPSAKIDGPSSTEIDPLPPLDGALDIDAALAAISSLDEILAQREADEMAERTRLQQEAHYEAERLRWIESYQFPHPPQLKLQRGGLASVIPALALALTGIYLTFALIFAPENLTITLIGALGCGLIGLIVFAYGLAARRWARGSLFIGLLLIAVSGAILALPIGYPWPVLVGGIGLVLILAAILGRPPLYRLIPVGLALILSAIGFLLNVPMILPLTAPWIWLPVGIAGLLLLIGLIAHRRAV
ncbi:MAG: hypothetical protein MUF87_21875 [Anaerolineae bacterium]|jgi:hypothetical protein|nr:hypothetical protein [Anaerolineae bacterium]